MSEENKNNTSDVTLLTEHLTYRPTALIDDIVNSINILAFKATEAVERGLLAADPLDLGFRIPQHTSEEKDAVRVIAEKAKNEIENGVHQLETLLEAKIDKNFDRLEIYALRNILNVPSNVQDWIRLTHYEGLNFNSHTDEPNTESISILRNKLRETQKLHAYLRAESARNQATIAAIKNLVSNKSSNPSAVDVSNNDIYPAFAFLQKKGDLTGDVTRPVTTSASFVLSQLPALEGLTENLQPRLKVLAEIGDSKGSNSREKKNWDRERLEFIERETRRHLEVVQGLELGKQGELMDGDWQDGGRKIQKEEVIDLEKVVQEIIRAREDQGELNMSNKDGTDRKQKDS